MLSNVSVDSQWFITEYMENLKAVIDRLPAAEIQTAIDYLTNAYEKGQRIFIVGNGGSAATASHMACDLGKTVLGETKNPQMKRFAVISLTDNVASITAWANDTSYELVFAEQLKNLAQSGDLLIVITGSGNSPNIVQAVKAARQLGLKTFGLLGFDGGIVRNLVDGAVVVQSNHYGHIEDAHMILTHLITAYFKEALKALNKATSPSLESNGSERAMAWYFPDLQENPDSD